MYQCVMFPLRHVAHTDLPACAMFVLPHRLQVPLKEEVTEATITGALLVHVPKAKQPFLASFLASMMRLYRALNFVYMEVSPPQPPYPLSPPPAPSHNLPNRR